MDKIERSVKFKVNGSHSEQMNCAIAAIKGAFEQYSFEPHVQYEMRLILKKDKSLLTHNKS